MYTVLRYSIRKPFISVIYLGVSQYEHPAIKIAANGNENMEKDD